MMGAAMEIRRFLEEIKAVAALQPLDAAPTPYQAAWRGCCEKLLGCSTQSGRHYRQFPDNH
jgi:hypothetical protein